MRSRFLTFFGTVLLILASLTFSHADETKTWKLIELKELTMGYRDFTPGGHRPTLNGNGLENRTLGKELQLFFNTDIGRYFFWNNRVHGGTDEVIGSGGKGQFRDVGWQFWLGVRPSKYLTLEYEHHSQHMLDYSMPGRFPVEDSVGLKIHLYRDYTPSATIF
jgi:hypothetical protein